MSIAVSYNFRGLTAYVSDGAGETCIHSGGEAGSGTAGDLYPFTAAGQSVGWVDNFGTGHFDRSNSVAAKFAGFACATTGVDNIFRIDLPNDTYDLAFAAGSETALGWNPFTITFKDGSSTTLFTLSSTPTSGGDSFVDHNDVLQSAASWSNASPRRVTIAAGSLQITVGASFSGALSHLEITSVSTHVGRLTLVRQDAAGLTAGNTGVLTIVDTTL